ncbi:MAG: ABC-type branched-subunit amino acid transport system substrate-binding protein [Candidatus Azotimanducaceae bacterium]|jgi:ABC-type branched-subunit amino acid transport system substrate-binding protein
MSRNLYNPVGASRLPPYSVNGPTLLVMALLIATFLSSCNAPPPILSIGVLRDSESRNGEPTRRATQLAVEQVNKTGGLMVNAKEHQVQLVIMDSGQTPQQAIKAAQKLIADGVVAIIGPNSSLTALPVAGLAESVKIPFITPIATHAEITQNHKYAFRTAFSDDLQGEAMATFARKQLAAKTATVLFDISDAHST